MTLSTKTMARGCAELIRLAGVLLALSFAAQAAAYQIETDDGTIDVGSLDTLMGQQEKTGSSSPETEEAWAEGILGIDLNFDDVKTETVSYFMTEATNIIAFELFSDPGYYIVKNAKWFALFENSADLGWGVIDISALADDFKLRWGCGEEDSCEFTISHVTEFSGTITEVSEPGSIVLMLLGVLGLWAGRRQQR